MSTLGTSMIMTALIIVSVFAIWLITSEQSDQQGIKLKFYQITGVSILVFAVNIFGEIIAQILFSQSTQLNDGVFAFVLIFVFSVFVAGAFFLFKKGRSS